MEKLYVKLALIYSVMAMIFGVFYREFTKFNHFTGIINLSVMHTHYFMLGMFFFLILMLLEKIRFSEQKNIKRNIVIYQIGLNITAATFLVRGLTQVLNPNISKAFDSSISGVAGIGHILFGVSIVLILLKVKKSI